MRAWLLFSIGLLGVQGLAPTAIMAQAATDSDKDAARQKALEGLFLDYGVPSAPAFELLPDKPAQVTHLTTPKDLQGQLSTWYDGSRFNTGIAADARPFAGLAGSLRDYQKRPMSQVAWRTVVSIGTARRGASSSDVVSAIGLRIPLVDRGDPRSRVGYVDSLERTYLKALGSFGQPPFNVTSDSLRHRADSASKLTDAYRRSQLRRWWNAPRFDVGAALSIVAHSGTPVGDSVDLDKSGVWAAIGLPIGHVAQLTIAGKASWSASTADTVENARHLVGGRVRFFPNEAFGVSVEVAENWSRYEVGALNESWSHLAVGIELKVPLIKGWVNLAYGGDSSRRGDRDAGFTLQYAVFQERRMKQ